MFSRTENLIGAEALKKLRSAKVVVFGIGGVGCYVVEALARAGIGKFLLVDGDVFEESNLNRQLYALRSTLGRDKVEVAKERILDINPEAQVMTKKVFYLPNTENEVDLQGFDYIVDAIDTVTAKVRIIERAKAQNVPIISAMGAGNKLDATAFSVTDISKTSGCPLARVMRRELKERGIKDVKVVYSAELPINPDGLRAPSSISYVPAAAGLIIAGEVIKDLI